MEIFNLTLRQMLLMFTLMLAGYFLRKKKLLPENADIAMSKMETYVFVPALTLHTQMTKCTVQTFRESWILILYGAALVICGIALAYALAPILIPNDGKAQTDYRRNIYRYALTFGNYGFMGNFIVLGVFGADVFYR